MPLSPCEFNPLYWAIIRSVCLYFVLHRPLQLTRLLYTLRDIYGSGICSCAKIIVLCPDCPPTIIVLFPLSCNRESDDSSSQLDAVDSNKVYWSLSTSSYNLARDLLTEPHLHSCDSETPLLTSSHSSPRHHTSPSSSSFTDGCTTTKSSVIVATHSPSSQIRLNQTQSKKLRELLINIQDERLCQVCMCSRISAVFCPCGHHVSCYRCAKRLVKCPICRQPIGYVQYVYTH